MSTTLEAESLSNKSHKMKKHWLYCEMWRNRARISTYRLFEDYDALMAYLFSIYKYDDRTHFIQVYEFNEQGISTTISRKVLEELNKMKI